MLQPIVMGFVLMASDLLDVVHTTPETPQAAPAWRVTPVYVTVRAGSSCARPS
jgi:hypothetical protein